MLKKELHIYHFEATVYINVCMYVYVYYTKYQL